jgi:hypothetical protein
MSLKLIFRIDKGNVDQTHPYKFSHESLEHMIKYADGRVIASVWERARIQTAVNKDVLWDSALGHEIILTGRADSETFNDKVWRDVDGNWHFPPGLTPLGDLNETTET